MSPDPRNVRDLQRALAMSPAGSRASWELRSLIRRRSLHARAAVAPAPLPRLPVDRPATTT